MLSYPANRISEAILDRSKVKWTYSPASAKRAFTVTFVLAAVLGLAVPLGAQSAPTFCAPLSSSLRAAPPLLGVGDFNGDVKLGGSGAFEPAAQMLPANAPSGQAAMPVGCLPLTEAVVSMFAQLAALTVSPGLDNAATGEKRLPGNQGVAARPTQTLVVPMGQPIAENYLISQRCASGEIPKRECRAHWLKAIMQALEITSIENGWNVATDKWMRYTVFHQRDFFGNWFETVQNFQFNRWSNNDWFLAAYVGHPLQGAIYNYIWIQNDPWGKSLELENTRRYWYSRLRALAWTTFWTFQWRFGPLSEAAIGNVGQTKHWDPDAGKYIWGTGTVTLVTTPVGGGVWGFGEDAVDKYLIKRMENRYSHPLVLLGLSALTPGRSMANLMRFKAPWYSDSRPVKAWMHRKNRALR